jgi:hypothetical protein
MREAERGKDSKEEARSRVILESRSGKRLNTCQFLWQSTMSRLTQESEVQHRAKCQPFESHFFSAQVLDYTFIQQYRLRGLFPDYRSGMTVLFRYVICEECQLQIATLLEGRLYKRHNGLNDVSHDIEHILGRDLFIRNIPPHYKIPKL